MRLPCFILKDCIIVQELGKNLIYISIDTYGIGNIGNPFLINMRFIGYDSCWFFLISAVTPYGSEVSSLHLHLP